MNKKGQYFQTMNIFMFFIIIAILIGGGLALVMGGAIINYIGDNVLPDLQESVNTTVGEQGAVVVTTAIAFNNAIPWLVGLMYVLSLVFIPAMAYAFRITGNKYLSVLYLALSILIILLTILASNIYQDFYEGSDDLALELQAMPLISYLILYSPMILSILLTIGAVIVFSGIREDPI